MREADMASEEPFPMEDILEFLGFEPNDLGGYDKKWGLLELSAIVGPGGWRFISSWFDGRTADYCEFGAPSKVVPVRLLTILYANCGKAFGGDLPAPLIRGKQEWDNLRAAKPAAD